MKHVIALDVGGTGMKAALVAQDGTLLHVERRPTGREQGTDAVVAGILDFAAHLRDEGLRRYGTAAAAAGVAVPGTIDEEQGIALFSANLGWRDLPLRRLLGERLNQWPEGHPNKGGGGRRAGHGEPLPVVLGHDVRTGAFAEGRIGAGKGADRFFFVALGTGIAGGYGIGGRIDAGAHGNAGEIGHIVIRPDGPPCGCGAHGCLETLASAAAVTRAWAEASGDPDADAADCARAVEAGDKRAQQVWADAIAALADGLIVVQSLLDPRTVILGGGLAEAGETLFTPLRAALQERITFQVPPTLVPAMLKDTAGCLGAGLLAWDLLSLEVTA
ncbi:ROK family protein [Streptacidiphilus sp. EB103A]|uniref:ROK family protein n=1 Tax=Streptacidiphilus sp. EB103A TaxID=3156275 RepID=UPI003515C86D